MGLNVWISSENEKRRGRLFCILMGRGERNMVGDFPNEIKGRAKWKSSSSCSKAGSNNK
jgi:hypothetical protein